MRVEMRPETEGEREVRLFVVVLDRDDANKLYGMDSIYGRDDGSGIGFWLYAQLSSAQGGFIPMPFDVDPQGYQLTVGGSEAKGPEELARMLQQRGRVPIELPSRKGRKPVNVGYVTFEFRPRAA